MKQDTYNGYKNRSTWLVQLHIDNTSRELNDLAYERAIQANTLKHFKSMISPILQEMPILWKEQDFNVLEVDFSEIWNSLAGDLK